MQSHVCEFKVREILPLIARPLLPVALFAFAMHLGTRTGLLPAPRPTLDIDRVVLVQKAEASRAVQDAEVVLLGDSSCLMDVAAPLLGERLGSPVLNLGVLSYLSLESHAALLRNFIRANPGRLRAVILLMNPEALRMVHADAWQNRALRCFLDGEDFRREDRPSDAVTGVLGLHIFQGRLMARLLPQPLPGAFGRQYGFTRDLERFLTMHRGSALDPESKPATGRAEYRLANGLKPASASLRAAVPNGVRLFVGITPLPEGYAGRGHPARHAEMLREWADWLKADAALTNLPPILPDRLFAQKTHLTEAGQREFTEQLAAALRPLLAPPGMGQ